ncbi:MAG: 16S rRNA (adenine(1518)-N(6)/adenine(1519)-N(6))-dimethyltransferase [Candidatus Aquiluna sp. XM-24bin5]|nr:MAG: 16S rRNA (adenine(1518)-N(6)/adenine(1519)-N(6))-dimethyltransferase [Candidatus Aquiluna sp. XM-24bin5]
MVRGPVVLGAADIRRLAAELDLRPTKKLGQNFVIDPNTIRRIVSQAHLKNDDVVVEIGPGLGSLTLGILEVADSVIAVEVDPKLASILPRTVEPHLGSKSLQLIEADALRVTELPAEPTALVANLPYNISVPVLLHFLETFPSIQKALVMVQAEVAHRLAAKPGGKEYGAPSVKLEWFGNARLAGNVGRSIFWPVPGVDSALVFFERGEARDGQSEVFEVIDAAFAQRRKTLRQALAGWAGSAQRAEELLVAAGISPSARGEELGIDEFIRVASSK